MSRKLNYKSISPFHDRLFMILSDNVNDWAEKINVSPSVIRDKWFKGSYPGADKIIKICEASGKSSGWLLFGKEEENCAENCEVKCGKKVAELCKKVKDVVESNTHWGSSLEANIHSFKAGLDGDKEIKELKESVTKLKKSIPGLLSATVQKQHGAKKKGKI